ncbi:hypothetical protein B296_00023429 [Ensete ventricosum]|uniref:Ketoreductase domain-containing protein n=1 Tax=Ensete ventricosum TaxID=4639 RepID=A0A427ANM6_ENSVE|nr:hypothetical protein B296_00023429 [Ensete ventricosum]
MTHTATFAGRREEEEEDKNSATGANTDIKASRELLPAGGPPFSHTQFQRTARHRGGTRVKKAVVGCTLSHKGASQASPVLPPNGREKAIEILLGDHPLYFSAARMLRLVSRYVLRLCPLKLVETENSSSRWLEGKVALITGGAGGLGKAAAREFIEEGATVVLADVDAPLGEQAAQQLGPHAQFVECDVTVEQQVAEAVDFAVARHGRLHIMHNSAGIAGSPRAPDVARLDLADFDHVMGVNVRGTLAGIKHAARVMAPTGSGSIICISSVSGLMGGLGTHPYTISKFAVTGIVKSVAGELCRRGVRVNCISPFVIPTRLVVDQLAQIYGDVGRQKILEIVDGLGELNGAKCEEIDVAKAAVYLASDDSKYIAGHNLVLDGGFTSYKQLNLPMPDRLEL